jgi:hypothetical protein
MTGLRETLERYLTDGGGELALDYAIGDGFSGRTELTLGGDGAYRAMSTGTPDRRPIEFTGTVDATAVRGVVEALTQARVWEAVHVRDRPGEDDPEASIAAASPEGGGEVRLWVSEIRRVPQFAQAQDALLAFLRQVSEGAIRETGR